MTQDAAEQLSMPRDRVPPCRDDGARLHALAEFAGEILEYRRAALRTYAALERVDDAPKHGPLYVDLVLPHAG